LLTAGQVLIIPSNVVHSGQALTPCKVLDVFNPVREDYL
jgi:quercetin dioxygenase-like cupin family protein